MQNAETVLNVIRERGRRGLPLERLYRQLFNPELFLLAYGRIYTNAGAMTPGVTNETVDGMSLTKIDTIIDALRREQYRWRPVKRVHIPKPDGRQRPLGLPTWSDKLVAEVVRLLLEAYYDVGFSDHSHGFRPGRGCHTALGEVVRTWKGTRWFIEGDISDCFGSLDHQVMLSILAEKIHDNRFLRLIGRMLEAGYLQDWRWHATLSGAPQGGVASPILSNIYLDRFDVFVEQSLFPDYNHGSRRRPNPDYRNVEFAIARANRAGDSETARQLRACRRQLPSQDPTDPSYRRLRYVRYADDWLLGFAGPRHEAVEIKSKIQQFLADELRLELSESKTLISHARSQPARFLGYEIRTQQADTKITRGRRAVNGAIGLFVPTGVIRKRCRRYTKEGKPALRGSLVGHDDYTIVKTYGDEYRGLVQYYLLAQDVHRLDTLRWVTETSMLKTLAAKHRSTVNAMARRYKAVIDTPDGPRTCFEAAQQREGREPLVARFGDISLKRQRIIPPPELSPGTANRRVELIGRLTNQECELCGTTGHVAVHHVSKLADLERLPPGDRPDWMNLMAQRRRKTLVVCEPCHDNIHSQRTVTTRR